MKNENIKQIVKNTKSTDIETIEKLKQLAEANETKLFLFESEHDDDAFIQWKYKATGERVPENQPAGVDFTDDFGNVETIPFNDIEEV